MIFKKISTLLLVGIATASALFTNGTNPSVSSNVVSGTTTLAPNYSVVPITTTYSYIDSMTTLYVTNTIYQTLWLNSASTAAAVTTTQNTDTNAVAKIMNDVKPTSIASTTTILLATHTSNTPTTGSTIITSAPKAKSSFGYLNSTIADTDTTTSTSTSYIYTTLTMSAPPSGSCVPKVQYVTVTATPSTKFVTITQSVATSFVTVTAQPSFGNSTNILTTASYDSTRLTSTSF